MPNRILLEDRVAIITGSGRGIGRAHALEFGARGAAVVVNDVERSSADSVVEEIVGAGGRAIATSDSVAAPDGAQRIIDAAVAGFGRVDVVVNNAGNVRNGYFEDMTPEAIEAVIAVHLKGAFYVTRAAWPLMKKSRYGRVVLTSSSSGMFSHQGLSNYAAAKAGVWGLMKALAFEGAPFGIKVNALLPGASTTITSGDPIPGMQKYWTDDFRSVMEPRRRAEAVAPMAVLLASEDCPVSGEAFIAMSGWYGRVFVGKAAGWAAPHIAAVTAEDLVDHWGEIRQLDGYSVPADTFDDMREVAAAVAPFADAGAATPQ
jgi:NAD(P)-dependent dehydrogenase (short-subunit alcohol dehydrogenase family)